nr:MAG TPA: hypothetical protein [Caudoviricetes sp.]
MEIQQRRLVHHLLNHSFLIFHTLNEWPMQSWQEYRNQFRKHLQQDIPLH